MHLNANHPLTNLLVTGLVALLVFLLPRADRRICRHLSIDPAGGVSDNPAADWLLLLRQGILLCSFLLYLAALAYFVFFSRRPGNAYAVHAAPLSDLQRSVETDLGLADILRITLSDGLSAGISHIRVVKPENIAQIYMNVMLFVPMGYLLPYLFRWFRARVRIRPVLFCLFVSFAVENLQLLTRRGLYDLDDLISNTAGGYLGQSLYIAAGYVVAHPAWKKELAAWRRWKRNARKRALYPFARKTSLSRTTLFGTDETAVWDFYITLLGFRPLRQLIPGDSPGTDFLFGMGKHQVEIRCTNQPESPGPQFLTIRARHLPKIRQRLLERGIEPGPYEQDPYTSLRRFSFPGPDGVTVTILEE